jgi:hypothetical protein
VALVDEWARPIVLRALVEELGRDPYAAEVYAVSCVARLETVYGSAWKGAGVGSNNWGAYQAGKQWTGQRFSYTDTHPNADGTNAPYRVDFRKYATALDGCRDLVRLLMRMGCIGSDGAATRDRTFMSVSRQLYARGYYEGFGRTPEERVANHCKAVTAAARTIAKALNEPIGLGDVPVPERVLRCAPELPGPPPVISEEDTLQARINAVVQSTTETRSAARDREMAQ